MAVSARVRVLFIAALIFAGVGALVWYLSTRYWAQPVTPLPAPPSGATRDAAPAPNVAKPAVTPGAQPSPTATPATESSQQLFSPPFAPEGSPRLLIPVAGVGPDQLSDTYSEARSEGRTHNAIDIVAPRGTPVLAASDGRIVKLFRSDRGGITVYQLSPDEKTVYYYAHLERYADGLREGHYARRGETIAYVGDTGNATPGNYHLHFQVYRINDPKSFWEGDNLNPYELLK